MPLMLELVGQQRWADQVRILREVRDDASAATALVVFSKLMCSYPDAKWALDGWWAPRGHFVVRSRHVAQGPDHDGRGVQAPEQHGRKRCRSRRERA